MTGNIKRRMAALGAAVMLLGGCSRAKAPVVASAPPLPTAITAPAQTLPVVAQEEMIAPEQFNDFSLRIFQSQRGSASWVVSPVNVALALGQLRPGAQEETAAQLDSTLGLDGEYSQEQIWASLAELGGWLEKCCAACRDARRGGGGADPPRGGTGHGRGRDP